MKTLDIFSKSHGQFKVLLDDADYERIIKLKSLKWCPRVCKGRHELVYFQKRLPGGKLIELHRWLMNFPKDGVVDHINNNTLDNRRENLKIISNANNIRKGKIRTNNTSGYTGIKKRMDYTKRPWYATIRVNYRVVYLGSFKTFGQALDARKRAELKYNQ